MVTIRDDDAGSRVIILVIRDDDHTEIYLMPQLTLQEGGTESDLSATGPGLIQQGGVAEALSVLPLLPGQIPIGDSNSEPAVVTRNVTSTRMFLVQRVLIGDNPATSFVEIDATDIASGVLSAERGGTGNDISGLAAGIIFWAGSGGALGSSGALTVNDSGTNNVGMGVAANGFGTNAQRVLGLANATAPTTSPADMIQVFSVDAAAGNATLGLRTEAAVVTESVVSDRTLKVVLNGTVYRLCLKV